MKIARRIAKKQRVRRAVVPRNHLLARKDVVLNLLPLQKDLAVVNPLQKHLLLQMTRLLRTRLLRTRSN